MNIVAGDEQHTTTVSSKTGKRQRINAAGATRDLDNAGFLKCVCDSFQLIKESC